LPVRLAAVVRDRAPWRPPRTHIREPHVGRGNCPGTSTALAGEAPVLVPGPAPGPSWPHWREGEEGVESRQVGRRFERPMGLLGALRFWLLTGNLQIASSGRPGDSDERATARRGLYACSRGFRGFRFSVRKRLRPTVQAEDRPLLGRTSPRHEPARVGRPRRCGRGAGCSKRWRIPREADSRVDCACRSCPAPTPGWRTHRAETGNSPC